MISLSVLKRGGKNVKFNRIFQNGVILFNGFCSDCCSVRNWRLYWCESVETERERIESGYDFIPIFPLARELAVFMYMGTQRKNVSKADGCPA